MDIGRAIQYWLNDPQWIKKVLIGGLLFFIPIIGWLIIGGYLIRIVQDVSSGNDVPLPEWNQWGEDLVRGLKWFVIAFVWSLPATILQSYSSVSGGLSNGSGLAVSSLSGCLAFLVYLAVTFITPVLMARFAQRETIGDAFNFNAILQDAQKIPAQLLIFVVITWVVWFVSFIGLILCFVGVFFTWFIAALISVHLTGQISGMLEYRHSSTTPTPPPANTY